MIAAPFVNVSQRLVVSAVGEINRKASRISVTPSGTLPAHLNYRHFVFFHNNSRSVTQTPCNECLTNGGGTLKRTCAQLFRRADPQRRGRFARFVEVGGAVVIRLCEKLGIERTNGRLRIFEKDAAHLFS